MEANGLGKSIDLAMAELLIALPHTATSKLKLEVKMKLLLACCVVLCEYAGILGADTCDKNEFIECLSQLDGKSMSDLKQWYIKDAEERKMICDKKIEALRCTQKFVSKCMTDGEQKVFNVTTGGVQKSMKQFCTDGSSINEGYQVHLDCWEKIKPDIAICDEKFRTSHNIILKNEMDERLKIFHECCAMEWLKNCKVDAANMKCSYEAGKVFGEALTTMGGPVFDTLCTDSISSCHGLLFGVTREEFESSGTVSNSMFTSYFMCFIANLILLRALFVPF